MHSRARGKSGSKKPVSSQSKSWVSYSASEVEQLVVKLSKSGKSTAQVGLVLRDSYGIPDIFAVANKKVLSILKHHNLNPKIPDDLVSLIKKEDMLKKHLAKNKFDMPARRGLLLTTSKIRRLIKYYIRENVLPNKWAYNSSEVVVSSS